MSKRFWQCTVVRRSKHPERGYRDRCIQDLVIPIADQNKSRRSRYELCYFFLHIRHMERLYGFGAGANYKDDWANNKDQEKHNR